MNRFDAELMQLLLDAVDGLPLVEKKRMFGFEALWADGRIFALVWQGRVSMRLPDPPLAAQLLAQRGAAPFNGKTQPGGTGWISVPESFHDDPHELRRWATHAHALASQGPPPKKKPRKRQ